MVRNILYESNEQEGASTVTSIVTLVKLGGTSIVWFMPGRVRPLEICGSRHGVLDDDDPQIAPASHRSHQ